jgi:protein TonB
MPEIDEYPIMESCVEVATTYEDQKICSDKKMMMYIYQNIQYPDMARTAGVEGTVVVSFSIDKQGNVKDLSLIRNPGYGCGAEVLRIINIMVKETNWIAGKKNGQPVICRMNRPVRFRLN